MQNTLLQILPFLVLVLAHHFLLSPLLRKKRWLYAVLTAVLLGGFAVNAAWCLWQNAKNKSFADYGKSFSPWFLAGLAPEFSKNRKEEKVGKEAAAE